MDKKEGRGKWILENGEEYSGGFKNDKVHGRGRFRRSDGSVICG